MELSLIGHNWRLRSTEQSPGAEPVVIVRVAGESGDVPLLGEKVADAWRFRLQANDSLADFLDAEDAVGVSRKIQSPLWVHSWPAAVALLEQYPWAELAPEAVHTAFRESLWREVNCRHATRSPARASRRIDDWRKRCEISAD